MPINIDSINFYTELGPVDLAPYAAPTDWLLANIGDKVRIETTFTVKTFAISSEDSPIIMNNRDGLIGEGWMSLTDNGFANFKIGDQVIVYDYIGSDTGSIAPKGSGGPAYYTVVDKLDDSTIQLDQDVPGLIPATSAPAINTVISIINPITAVKYKYNFIENEEAENYNSKISETEQILINKLIDAANVTPLDLEFLGELSYQIGSGTVQGVEIDDGTADGVYKQTFKIIHETYITPFFLSEQWADALSGVAPDYFFDTNCLRAVISIEALYNYSDPNRSESVQLIDVMGNSGWFNENYNTGITNYSLESVAYENADAETIDSVELTANETTVTITINNTADTPFVDGATEFIIGYTKAPEINDEYQSNGKNVLQNFYFDRARQTVGVTAVNGDNYGTNYQVLKDVAAEFVSDSQIIITAKIAFNATILSEYSDLDIRRYLLFVSIADHTLDPENSDKTTLLVDANDLYQDVSDPGMIIITNKYVRHMHSDPDTDGVNAIDVFPEDEIVACSQFYVDKEDREDDVITLRSAEAIVKAKNSSTGEEFVLDNFKLDMSGLSVINDNQFVAYELDRVFDIPSSEIRKKISIQRRDDLDTATKFYYDFTFPFLMRWEYWKALAGVNGDFFDTSESNNGFNHFWHHYTEVSDWGIYYELKVIARKNGESLTYTFEDEITSNDYDANPDWEPNTIKAYNNETNELLYDAVGMKNYLLGYEYTRIEAEFTNNYYTPSLDSLSVVMGIEVYEEGGIEGRRRFSSVWEADSETWFKSVDDTDKVLLSIDGNTITATALVDFSKLPLDKSTFKITARIYDLTAPCGPSAKTTEDGLCKETESGDVKTIE